MCKKLGADIWKYFRKKKKLKRLASSIHHSKLRFILLFRLGSKLGSMLYSCGSNKQSKARVRWMLQKAVPRDPPLGLCWTRTCFRKISLKGYCESRCKLLTIKYYSDQKIFQPWREFKEKLLVFAFKTSPKQQVWQTCYLIWNGTH